jgi:hypothetical protein
MLKQGYSMKEVLEYFMKHGKTDEEERRDLLKRLQVSYFFHETMSELSIDSSSIYTFRAYNTYYFFLPKNNLNYKLL